jgi:hypothetical protein
MNREFKTRALTPEEGNTIEGEFKSEEEKQEFLKTVTRITSVKDITTGNWRDL